MNCLFNRKINSLCTVYGLLFTLWRVCRCISSELRNLAWLFGGRSEESLIGAYVARLLNNAKQTLRASSRMDEMNVRQLLGRTCAIMKDGMTTEEPFMSAYLLIGTNIPFTKCHTNISCYRCSGPNHYTKDCKYRPQGPRKDHQQVQCFRCE